jgi:16S rRNA (guanine966-N2)-methyltransferase
VTRIVAGIAGGRRLRTPDGDRTRPTSGRVREAVFSTIESLMGSWDGVHVLDLYAGSGALGLDRALRPAGRGAPCSSSRTRRTAVWRARTPVSSA